MKKIEVNFDDYNKVKKDITVTEFLLLYFKSLGKLNFIPTLFHTTMEYHDVLRLLETRQYIKIVDDCVIYDGNDVEINVECFELRAKATQIFDIASINYEELANKLRAIFPAKIRGGAGRLVKSPTLAVIDKLKKFFKYYPNITEKNIIAATTNYIENRRKANWVFITQLDYFIFKDNVSMLYSEVESLDEESESDWTKNIV